MWWGEGGMQGGCRVGGSQREVQKTFNSPLLAPTLWIIGCYNNEERRLRRVVSEAPRGEQVKENVRDDVREDVDVIKLFPPCSG